MSLFYGDVAVCAVEDAGRDVPIIVCHALDSRFVLTRESHTLNSGATNAPSPILVTELGIVIELRE